MWYIVAIAHLFAVIKSYFYVFSRHNRHYTPPENAKQVRKFMTISK